MSLCNDCPNRDLCSCLCPEAELYVNQDHIPQREKPIGMIKPMSFKLPWPDMVDPFHLTKTEKQILTLIASGLDNKNIQQVLNITRKTLNVHMYNIRKKS